MLSPSPRTKRSLPYSISIEPASTWMNSSPSCVDSECSPPGCTSITNGSMCRADLPEASERKSSTPVPVPVSRSFRRSTAAASSLRVTTGPTAVSSSSSVPRRTPSARVTLISGASDGGISPLSRRSIVAESQSQRSASSSVESPSDSRSVVSLLPIRRCRQPRASPPHPRDVLASAPRARRASGWRRRCPETRFR